MQRGKIIVYGGVVGTHFYRAEKENIKEIAETTHRVYTCVMEINLGNNVDQRYDCYIWKLSRLTIQLTMWLLKHITISLHFCTLGQSGFLKRKSYFLMVRWISNRSIKIDQLQSGSALWQECSYTHDIASHIRYCVPHRCTPQTQLLWKIPTIKLDTDSMNGKNCQTGIFCYCD